MQPRDVPIRGTLGVELRRFLRANASSMLASGVDWAVITVLVGLRVHYLLAATIGALVGAATDFTIKRNWAFMRGAVGAVHTEAARYIAVSGLSLGWNLLVSYLLVDGLHFAPVPGVIAASIFVGIAWNYPVHRYFVFANERSSR